MSESERSQAVPNNKEVILANPARVTKIMVQLLENGNKQYRCLGVNKDGVYVVGVSAEFENDQGGAILADLLGGLDPAIAEALHFGTKKSKSS